jgi:group I intron endonuclease
MTQVIYKIVNLVNDKFYVGSTTNKKVRFREHRKQLRGNRHHCKHLQAAWNKYGEEKFDFRVVEEVPNEQALHEVEDRWLKEHFGKPHCYNSGAAAVAPWRGVYGAEHFNFGKEMATAQKEQISQTLKDFYAQDYFNHPRVGKQHTEETKAQISASKKANPIAYWEGKERSEETKAKISEAQLGKPKGPGRKVSEAGKAKIRANIEAGRSHMHWLGRTHTEEAKQKMRKRVLEQTSGQIFDSLTAVLAHYQMTMPTLRRALLAGTPITKGKFAGLLFVYA